MYGRTQDDSLVPRQSTGFTSMPEAEALRDSISADSKDREVHGLKLSECIDTYIESRQHELGNQAFSYTRLTLSRLRRYCEARGKFFIRELTVDLLESFKFGGLPEMANTSRREATAKVRCFLRDAFRRGWLTEQLVDRVKPHSATYEQKEPYTDAEVHTMLEYAGRMNGAHGYGKHPETFRLLLELMLETGMRVGDAVRYNPAVVTRGKKMWIYTFTPQKQRKTKQPKSAEAYISDRLKKDIDACEWLSEKLPFYWTANKSTSFSAANLVYLRMRELGKQCGIMDCRPHRLRDTFAIRMLLRGVPLEDVSRLLAHSSVKITETYYAKWVTARKARLEGIVAEALVNT